MATISFVDVGQGDCTVVVDDYGDALVIDCPRNRHGAALAELDARGGQRIGAAIITHSDEDHSGGMLDLIEALSDRFDGLLFFNCDSVLAMPVIGPDHGIAGKRRRALINRAREYRGRVRDARSGVGGSLNEIHWKLLSPNVDELLDALADGDPNLASGIVFIGAGEIDVIVGGDAPLATWERAAGEIPEGATVRWPHHGGRISSSNHLQAQERLFDILNPKQVIVSVGSSNTHDHPFRAFFDARGSHGAKLMCTEATKKCVADGVGRPCAGTIRLGIHSNGSRLEADAPDFLARISSFGNAQCMPDAVDPD